MLAIDLSQHHRHLQLDLRQVVQRSSTNESRFAQSRHLSPRIRSLGDTYLHHDDISGSSCLWKSQTWLYERKGSKTELSYTVLWTHGYGESTLKRFLGRRIRMETVSLNESISNNLRCSTSRIDGYLTPQPC